MDKSKNYYKLLDVEKTATPKEIKLSYYALSKEYHPDKTFGDKEKEAIFKIVAEAYEVLSNSKLKEDYDKNSKWGANYDEYLELLNFDFSNTAAMKDNFQSSFEKSKDELIDILLVINKFQSIITYDRLIYCNYCDATGYIQDAESYDCDLCNATGQYNDKSCSLCKGKGYIIMGAAYANPNDCKCQKCNGLKRILVKDKIKIKKSDFDENNKLRIPQRGNYCRNNIGKVGDLFIMIS